MINQPFVVESMEHVFTLLTEMKAAMQVGLCDKVPVGGYMPAREEARVLMGPNP